MSQKPYAVGRIVRYVSHGTPYADDGAQEYPSEHRMAAITEVGENGRVGVCVINPTGFFFHPLSEGGCDYDPTGSRGGTWHWPEHLVEFVPASGLDPETDRMEIAEILGLTGDTPEQP